MTVPHRSQLAGALLGDPADDVPAISPLQRSCFQQLEPPLHAQEGTPDSPFTPLQTAVRTVSRSGALP